MRSLTGLIPENAMKRFASIGGCSLVLSLGLVAGNALAQQAGEVEFSRGVGFAQAPGQPARILGKGLPLREGDRLTTSEGSAAIVKLQDGTRMTLRPNSEMVMQQYQYKEGAPENSMLLHLVRGGFRAITGLISKNSPNAARVQTSTATIGIRGTDFDARLCGPECKAESARVNEKPKVNAVLASAKLVSSNGDLAAIDSNGQRRKLVDGASVYAGEVVETGPGSRGLLAFRDESKVTLGASTRFRVESFVFDDKNPSDGRFIVSLLQGSLRALTGLIGKASTRNVGFRTSTATIGIRGTGLDLDCRSVAAGSDPENCSIFTWLGAIEVTPTGQGSSQLLSAGQGLVVGRVGVQPLGATTLEGLPRPDSVPVNTQQLFSSGGVSSDDEGLFVFVRDGHIEISSAKETIHLGRGETGFSGADGRMGRPGETPLFIQFDRVPLPNSSNPNLAGLIGEVTGRPANQCR